MMACRRVRIIFFILSLCWVQSPFAHGRGGPNPLGSAGTAIKAKTPFLAVEDHLAASSNEIEQIYRQASNISKIAFFLFGAAESLSHAPGSSNALLPYLTPVILRLYSLLPARANSSVVRELYEVSSSLYGSSANLQACYYDMYKSMGAIFSWVRDTIPLQLQEVPGQDLAPAMWPDMGPLELTAAVASALSSSGPLNDTAVLLSSSCGLTASNFAALVPNITSILKDLHKDLSVFQSVVKKLHDSNFAPGMPVAHNTAGQTLFPKAVPNRRRMQQQQAYNRSYFFPPSTFTPAPPATLPDTLIPLIFHIMLYKNTDGSVGPVEYERAAALLDGMLQQVNQMSKPTKFQFFIREVRNDPIMYPYLLLDSRATWHEAPFCKKKKNCIMHNNFMEPAVADWPRSINIFVASDTTGGNGILGYSNAPGSDFHPANGFVFVSWDSLASSGFNSPTYYFDGANTLLHEIFHYLGLQHSFGPSSTDSCNDDDYVIDTPVAYGPIYGTSSIYAAVVSYCLDIFWSEYGGSWNRIYEASSKRLGIPEADINAWADSCPKKPGYDELGNYMTYTAPVCLVSIGHLTPGQVQRAHYVTAEMNPILYAWGQYYAAVATPPPPQATPPPDPSLNICKVSAGSCPCKSKWTFNGTQYAYCSQLDSTSDQLWCEVQNAATCSSCAGSGQQSASSCVMPCDAGATPGACNTTQYSPLISKVPPPLPPSPPPYPPPPPPTAVREECKVAVSGCACRSTWAYGVSGYSSYCSSPDGRRLLWCMVSPTCPNYATMPFHYCASNLTVSYCGTGARVYFSTTRIPPPPPPPAPLLAGLRPPTAKLSVASSLPLRHQPPPRKQ
ncbi:hypothetical protein Vretimale_17406 [Volvox reticuliferus]|uniref:Peptidase M43 pregnancy-associated plasma-A domain-containing protein n=1 Tax=Volvox reticuliferus TaxID=1737510 RepID=A0A8J4LYC0_9CHLO|nr:hypothetical protein Vretimale_17406 [Volvox reticuliferus]